MLPADFLDPLYHVAATGRPSINLDGWMLSKQQNLESFWRHAADADVCIVEGCMGLFDGRDGKTAAGSTAEMAKWLGAPVLLVMDCWSMVSPLHTLTIYVRRPAHDCWPWRSAYAGNARQHG